MVRKNRVRNFGNKTIWIDLDNSPHVVFFRPIIEELQKHGYEVVLTARNCFQVCELADLFKMQYKRIGRHYGKNKILKVLGTLNRSLQMIPFALKNKPTLVLCHGSRSQLLTAKMLGVSSIMIYDYEYTKTLLGTNPTYVIAPELLFQQRKRFNKSHLLVIQESRNMFIHPILCQIQV